MKVECVEEGSCKRHLDIEIPPQSVTKAFDDEVEQYRRTLKLKGFRKGKLPKELVRTRFRAEILNQVVQEILPKALQQALKDQGLSPIGEPELSNLEVDVDQPLKFRASIEIMPKIEVEKWKGLEALEQKTAVSDEEIEKRLETLRERAARFDPVEDRGARDGDFIIRWSWNSLRAAAPRTVKKERSSNWARARITRCFTRNSKAPNQKTS